MTNKHDFKAVLEVISQEPKIQQGDKVLLSIETSSQTVATIQTALRIAQRLQSGEVSYGMFEAWDNAGYPDNALPSQKVGIDFKQWQLK